MRILAAALAMAMSAAAAHAQSLEEKYQAKTKEAFLTKAAWTTDYDAAREEAKKSGKLIFVYFTRSYSP